MSEETPASQEAQSTAIVPAQNPIVQKEDGNVAVTALVPNDMACCQDALVKWCRAKLQTVQDEAKELSDAFVHAKLKKWKSEPLRKHAKLAARRVVFYAKMLTALEHGYVIVPNFPVEMFAMRTEEGTNVRGYARIRAGWNIPLFQQESPALPHGEGEYKNPFPHVGQSEPFKVTPSDSYDYVRAQPTGWDELEFPLVMAKPEIMEATDRAMALKIFDEIGILPAETKSQTRAKGDPIIVGRLLDPRGRVVSFMIAWHLDTRSL